MIVSEVNIYGLLTTREVKMAGYWPSSFSACLWTETESRSINSRTRLMSSHLDLKSFANKGFISWLSGKFFSRDTAGSLEQARLLHLVRSVANQRARLSSSCPPYNKSRYTIAMYYRTGAWKHRGDCSLCMHTQMYVVLGLIIH